MQICMDWRSVTFDWNRARAFLVTAEEGSLSAAAKSLGMTQPTLGRQVSALETELGVILFERSRRGLILTPSGLELLEHVRSMGEAASRVSLSAGGQAQAIEGTICITASEMASVFLLPPIIERLRRKAPGIEVEIIASNATVDLRRREADIALRNVRPTQPDLIARKVRNGRVRLYASHTYLARIGNPQTPEELNQADFIAFNSSSELRDGLNALGLSLTPKNFPIMTSSHIVHWELVKHGAGIGVIPEVLGEAEASVRQALPQLPPLEYPVWLTTHRELQTSRRVRLVFDFLAEEISRLAI
jgi:DNA-binding transcriptional LysR family regulator